MEPYIPPGTIEAVSRVLMTRWIGQGPKVDEFERKFSVLMQGRPSVAVGSCTDALHLSYILAGIREGSEVIAPLFTCTATNIPLLYQRAKIKFCDVAPGALNMDPAAVEELITEETKAIVVVHYGGMPIDQRIFRIAEDYQIPVIEDCAQALGAQVGQRGKFACYSFQAVKHITTGDGGMLVLPEVLRAKAKRLRWFGIDREAKFKGSWENDITEVGYKYQMTDIGAAMGLAGLESLDFQLNYRRALRESYRDGLEGVDGIRLLDLDYGSACWLCTVAVERRDDFRRKLKENGIESDLTHYRNDRYTIFDDHVAGQRFPNMDAIDSKYLVIPLHMGMTVEDVQRICDVVRGGW
jgi:dTDP-4-amino-4,6-dideoxygalactose transaminase